MSQNTGSRSTHSSSNLYLHEINIAISATDLTLASEKEMKEVINYAFIMSALATAGMMEVNKKPSRLFVFDRKTSLKFLIDSVSEISAIPPVSAGKKLFANFSLYAVNNTKVPAYGLVNKQLDLGLRKNFA